MTGGVLWDLDGTLVDSEEFHWLAWRDTMRAEGVPITLEHFRATFGQRNDAVLPKWLGADSTPERIGRVAEAKEELYRRLVRSRGQAPLEGAAEWVRRLHAQGWKQAIASSAPAANVEVVLEAIGLVAEFEAISASEDVERGKPDPEVFLVAAEKLGLLPERCVVVEDAPAGVEAARRAGMRSIGIRRDGKALEADVVARSLEDLDPLVFQRLLGI